MNEYVKKAWEKLFNPPGSGSLVPGPRIDMLEAPEWVDEAYELVVPPDTPEVNAAFANDSASDILTITLPTSLVCLGKKIVVTLNMSGTPCEVNIANVMSGMGGDPVVNGTYILHAVQVSGAIVWAPVALTALASS